ncbi:MAG: long-chain fatty acid--CoA ligase [Bacteroidales bacterium]|jgi:long-chain acyl-CoA synthetase|nr:long-chain fatty acid--CoA ligase [Bacteroidales bacterium]MDD4177277.1 long-chain fatty acid--CoA ligase [Bacteroidales bacterium]MDD4741629.1 long-chain fatty acid--CoA ligase [Bacteroidales bacterium]MDY0334528.1 long-chain fatty acid--CoA ligase [Bacteroidales bacterium]NCU34884.1 long-chain fatty acid--CoA ligase [Candidatus Falkowbacteria bacterium]
MEVTRIFDLLDRYAEHFHRPDVFAGKQNGVWKKYTYNDYIRQSNLVSYGLMELGFQQGDKIATISNNRPEWNFADMGMMQIGVVHVPIYPTISSDEYRHILSHSGVKAAIISDKTLYQKLRKVLDTLDIEIQLYTFNGIEEAAAWQQVIDTGKANENKHREKLKQIKDSISPEDMATLIYTSGTTGPAKGVMLSHHNIVSNFIATARLQPLDERHKVLSFLPLCHIYERMMNYHFQYKGIGIYYAENLGTITADLVEVRADGFNTVPRLLEKVYDRIVSKGKDLSGIKKTIFFWALNLGLRYELNGKNGPIYELKLKIADRLIYSKWRAALGGQVKIIVSGGSALQPRLSRLFWAAGMRIMEGYGLTETAPVVAVSHAEYPNLKFGTVGPVLENVEVKIAEDGEILTKGPNLMMGYYKDPEYTREVIDQEGWFHTGDIGVLDEGKFLKITDRKKEIFKLSSGKYVAPQLIENMFKESSFIEQIMVVGENEKFASALISPNFNYLHFWAMKHKIHYRDNQELVNMPEVINRIQKEVNRTNERLGAHEQIKRFRLVCEEWTPQSGYLSQTLKLKRAVIYRRYDTLLRKIYNYPENAGR